MALTVSIAPATAPAPAARPTRAAAPAAPDSAEGFVAVLARTAERTANGQSARAVDADEPVEGGSERDETVDLAAALLGLEPCVRFMPPAEAPAAPEPAGETAVEDNTQDTESPLASISEAPSDAAVAVTPEGPAATTGAALAPEPALAPTNQPPVGAPAQSNDSGPERAQMKPASTPEELPAVDTPPGERNVEVSALRSQAEVTPAAKTPLPRAASRAAAQAVVAEVLAKVATSSAPAPIEPGRVATTPIQAGVAAVAANDSGVPAGKARLAQAQAPTEALPAETLDLRGSTTGHSDTGGRDSGQRPQEHNQPTGRTLGLAHGAGLPASMVFPGQATFAAAMERSLPLAQALPPGFSDPALDTVVPQVVRSMHMQVTAGGGDMTLTLTPEHLGTVTIELRVDRQRVSASLGADTAAVRGWIAAHEDDLKAGLADLGLELDQFVVRDEDARDRKEQSDGQPTPQRRKRGKSEDSVFEVQA